jgi:hypothetical protein
MLIHSRKLRRQKKQKKKSQTKSRNDGFFFFKKNSLRRKHSKNKNDGMFKAFSSMVSSTLPGLILSSSAEEGSYTYFIERLVKPNLEEKIKYIKNHIKEELTKEVGKPSHGRDWSDEYIESLLEILSRKDYKYRKINYDLLQEVITVKDIEYTISTDEWYDASRELYPIGKCGLVGEYYKIKDSKEKFILVEIIGYDNKNKKCKVKDVYTDTEKIIEPTMLEKRAKDLTDDEIDFIEKNFVNKLDDKSVIYPLGYKRLDQMFENEQNALALSMSKLKV